MDSNTRQEILALLKDCPNLPYLGMTVLPASDYAVYQAKRAALDAEDDPKYRQLYAAHLVKPMTSQEAVTKKFEILDEFQSKCDALMVGMIRDYCGEAN